MLHLNKVQIIGRLGKAPESKYTPTGKPVCSFSVAVKEIWKSDGEKKEKTTWFYVKAWGKLGENCQQYLEKGQQIYVEGRLDISQDEAGKTWVSLIANEVQFGDKAAGNGNGGGSRTPEIVVEAEGESEIPF